MTKCTEKDFLDVVKNHKMIIKLDSGVHRHLNFNSGNAFGDGWFDIVTWPRSLAISGDYGDYIFTRTNDMFNFFRRDTLSLNVNYWSEKLRSISRFEGYEEYDFSIFRKNVFDQVEYYFKDDTDEDEKQDLIDDLEFEIDSVEEDEYGAVEFYRNHLNHDCFTDFDPSANKPKYHYIWCLYAIVWGIQQYDKRFVQSLQPLAGK